MAQKGEVKDISGLVFGRLTVLSNYKRDEGTTYWLCQLFVEVHGEQHYRDNNMFNRGSNTLASIKSRDKTKKRYALKRGYYLEINLLKTTNLEDAISLLEEKIQSIRNQQWKQNVTF